MPFQKRWLAEDPSRASWLTEDPLDDNKFRCKLCMKSFSIGSMGATAVRSHETKSHGHQKAVERMRQQSTVSRFFNQPSSDLGPELETPQQDLRQQHSFVIKESVTRAEIIWAMKCIVSHYSYSSSGDVKQMFQAMFPDSEIAKKFSMGYDKVAYIITHGLAPCFRSELQKSVAEAPEFVVCFDESLNKTLKTALLDPLLTAKLEFFRSVSQTVEPFLKKFQSDKPMTPHLYGDIHSLTQVLLRRFIKATVVDASGTASKLMKIDVTASSANCLLLKDIDIGFGAARALRLANPTDLQKMRFREDCKKFLSSMVAKIFERSPLRFPAVRLCSSLCPKLIVNSRTLVVSRFQRLLELLDAKKIIASTVADRAKAQYINFCNSESNLGELKLYDEAAVRLDVFWANLIRPQQDYGDFWVVTRKVLTLSHGNATVESGFSVNADMLVENLREESLVAQRTVYDAIAVAGGVLQVEIGTKLLQSVRAARGRYRDALEARQRVVAREKSADAERKRAAKELSDLRVKKQKIAAEKESEIRSLDEKIRELEQTTKN